MILNTVHVSDVEYIGDIQENKVGIDRSNIDFITTLLTSNLYSKPFESFIRETVANAYDSHMEANTKDPILILIEPKDRNDRFSDSHKVSIRDYGIGLSPERFDSIYKNIGSSTKRESNDFIGMFGIGRFSCLSCADIANITSYYNNVKYSYLMYKNGGGINIDKISEVEGEYKNGLEVSIVTDISTNTLIDALNGICLFDKVFVRYTGENYSIKTVVENFNKRKVVTLNGFSKCSTLNHFRNYYRVGNVLYPASNIEECNLISNDGIIISLPMGEVDITPNREALQYTAHTTEVISQCVKNVRKEIQDLINSSIAKNISLADLMEDFIYPSYYTLTLLNKDGITIRLQINKSEIQLDSSNISINGEKVPDKYFSFLNTTKYFELDKIYIHKRIHRKIIGSHSIGICTYNIRNLVNKSYNLVIKDDKTTREITLKYLEKDLILPSVILTYGGLDKFKDHIIKRSSDVFDRNTIEECIMFTLKNVNIIHLNNSKVPSTFIEQYKKSKSTKKSSVPSDSIPIRVYSSYGYTLSNLSNLFSKNFRGIIIYSAHLSDSDDLDILKTVSGIAGYLTSIYAVISIRADKLKLLEGKKRFVLLEDFLYMKNKIMMKLATAYVINREYQSYQIRLYSMGTTLPIYAYFRTKYANELKAIDNTYNSYTLNSILKYYIDKGWVNSYDVGYYTLNTNERKTYDNYVNMQRRNTKIVKAYAMRKYGVAPRIGLNISNNDKINKDKT